MKKTAIIYSSTDGHTVRICEKIIEMIKHKSKVSLCSIEKADSLDLESFDFILVGASIRYGKYRKGLYNFIEKILKHLN